MIQGFGLTNKFNLVPTFLGQNRRIGTAGSFLVRSSNGDSSVLVMNLNFFFGINITGSRFGNYQAAKGGGSSLSFGERIR